MEKVVSIYSPGSFNQIPDKYKSSVFFLSFINNLSLKTHVTK